MWCKWDVMEIRTTKLADAFHRLIGYLLQSKYPPMAKLLRRLRMAKLLRRLRSCNTNVRGHLLNMDRRRTDGRNLKRWDRLRRIKIEREMR
ncbi:hypothetical protein ANCCAN_23586 [Ancylostoma caninum]|uniref:Uncharacterized protein n=1 Tax=Ancylostoma caninum TaxID=29170 RepID=A0A368FEM4_ANCCA|nr:hypothetical protein ANCCAN_23586 [Ancylostoma caninum]